MKIGRRDDSASQNNGKIIHYCTNSISIARPSNGAIHPKQCHGSISSSILLRTERVSGQTRLCKSYSRKISVIAGGCCCHTILLFLLISIRCDSVVKSYHLVFRVKQVADSGMASAGQLNYCYAVAQCIDWIVKSSAMEGPVPALLNGHLTEDEYARLKRTRDDWVARTANLSKLKKEEAPRRQRLSQMILEKRWAEIFTVVDTCNSEVIPELERLRQCQTLPWQKRVRFVNLLMFALVVHRACRPATYYSAYVSDARCT